MAGVTVHIPQTGPAHDRGRGHLHVVLTNPCSQGLVLLAPICSAWAGCDQACLLPIGCHPFVIRDSFVQYAKADVLPANTLKQAVDIQFAAYEGILLEPHFSAAKAGTLISRAATPAVRKYAVANL